MVHNFHFTKQRPSSIICGLQLLSTPMGVDNIDVGFNTEVQPLVTHNAG